MSDNYLAVLEAFERLPAQEREKVVAEILRRASYSEHLAPSDDELIYAADELFRDLDKREGRE
jgi:hypothetical protein